MEKKSQKGEADAELSLEELAKTGIRSVTAEADALFQETYPDFAHQVTQSIATGSRLISREVTPSAFRLTSEGSQRPNGGQRVDLTARIFAEHEPAIRLVIRQHAGANQKDEDDVYQNLYLSLVCNPPPQPLTNVTAYLNTVIQNAINAMRQRRNGREVIWRYAMSRVREEVESSPDDLATRTEEVQRTVDLAAELLHTREARAVIERYIYGYSTTSIARHMQVKRRRVWKYAREALRRVGAVVLRQLRTAAYQRWFGVQRTMVVPSMTRTGRQ